MPKILVVNQSEVEQLLRMAECIELMEKVLLSLTRKEIHQPLRTIIRPPDADGLMALMPAYRSTGSKALGLKAICVFPSNATKGKDAHQGGVILFSGETGEPLALMNASAITSIRTAAVSAVATRALSRPDATELAIIGAGVQARTHLAAISYVRRIRRARIASRTFAKAQAFAVEVSSRYSFPIEALPNVEETVSKADIVVTATTAHDPVLRRDWISPGTHINAVGTYSPAAREIDTATMVASTLFVDRFESAINESGDYLLAVKESAIGPQHIKAELGEVLAGVKSGRTSAEEITLFKSLGLAVEDLAAAESVFTRAQTEGVGTWVEF